MIAVKYTIYGLSDNNQNFFYVGCTRQPLAVRIYGHIWDAKNPCRKSNEAKVSKIRAVKYKPIVSTLQVATVIAGNIQEALTKASEIEKEWIARLIRKGHKLVNLGYVDRDLWLIMNGYKSS